MTADSRTTCRNVFLFLIGLSVVAWLVPLDSETLWIIRFGLPLASLPVGWRWLMQEPAPAHEAPDILGELFGSYFEREGLCFVPRVAVRDDTCWFEIYCQNRYSQGCDATVCCIPMEGMSQTGRHEVPPVIVDVDCAGGEVAVVRLPYPIAAKWQGKTMVYDVVARTRYPAGMGDCIRGGEGAPVGEPTSALTEAVKTTGLLALGIVRISKGASFELRLPERVRELPAPGDDQLQTEVLWNMDLPTGGFPVLREQERTCKAAPPRE